ncbi:MAG: energy transducer TonB [Acidobacteriota bacterium]
MRRRAPPSTRRRRTRASRRPRTSTFGRRISVPRQRYIYRVDHDSGVFEGILDEHERSRKPCSTIASLAFMPGSLATEPIMRLTFPVPPAETIATAPEAEIGPSVSGGAPAAAAPKPGEADVDSGYASRGNKGRLPDISFKVTVNSCDPTIEGGAGSDDNPVAIREGVTPPILLQGHVPQISRSLEGVSLILDVKVRRDGHVDDVKVVSGPDLPANLAAPVIRAIRLWEYEPAWCGDQPVASVFRMQMGWSRP